MWEDIFPQIISIFCVYGWTGIVPTSAVFLLLSSKTNAHARQDFYYSKQHCFCTHGPLLSMQNESFSEGLKKELLHLSPQVRINWAHLTKTDITLPWQYKNVWWICPPKSSFQELSMTTDGIFILRSLDSLWWTSMILLGWYTTDLHCQGFLTMQL